MQQALIDYYVDAWLDHYRIGSQENMDQVRGWAENELDEDDCLRFRERTDLSTGIIGDMVWCENCQKYFFKTINHEDSETP